MILDNLYMKFAVWRAGKSGYKAGRAFGEERAWVPVVVTDSLETLLDELAPIEPHIGLGSVDGNLVIVTINKRDAFKENWTRQWVASFRRGFKKGIAEAVPPSTRSLE